MNKRYDIQWLRALSIFVVLCFHLWPRLFPAGFLGVDMFFVISGYLMTRILSRDFKNEKPILDLVLGFYTRRIKRIFPTYYLTIFFTLVMVFTLLTPMDGIFVQQEAQWAVILASNMKNIFKNENYFVFQSSHQYFLHAWSLGVEIQYYVFAPFLLRWIAQSRNPIHRTFAIGAASLLLQNMLAGTTLSFGFLPCRLWQFLVGTAVYHIGDSPNFLPASNFKIIFTVLATMTLGARVFILSYGTMEPFWQMIATFGAGLVLVAGAHWQPDHSKVSHRLMTLLGDASYAIYLVHWPLVTLNKHTHYLESYGNLLLLLVILLVSFIQYEIIEKKIAKMPDAVIYFLVSVLVVTTGIMSVMGRVSFVKDIKVPLFVPSDITTEEAVRLNQRIGYEVDKMPAYCVKDPLLEEAFPNYNALLEMDGMCSVTMNSTTGTKTAVVLGNSYAFVHLETIVDILRSLPFAEELKKVYLIARAGCLPLPSLQFANEERHQCEALTNQTLPLLRKIKPELIVFSARFSHYRPYHGVPVTSTDNITAALIHDFQTISETTKSMVVIEPNQVASVFKPNPFSFQLAHTLHTGGNLTLLHTYHQITAMDYFVPGLRLRRAVDECEKCKWVNVIDKFCNDTICLNFDPKTNVSYFGDNQHMSRVGIGMYFDELRTAIADAVSPPTPAPTTASTVTTTTPRNVHKRQVNIKRRRNKGVIGKSRNLA